MELEEARNEAELLEGLVDYGQGYPPHLSDGEEACIVLNHRITELEAQRDELAEMIGVLVGIVESVDFENDDDAPSNEEMNRWHNAAIIEASDKEDKG